MATAMKEQMLKTTAVIAMIAMVSVSAAQATVTGSYTSAPTVGLADHTTYEITLTSDTGNLTGFEVEVTADVANQVTSGGDSIFEDSNSFIFFIFGNEVWRQDTQFHFMSTDLTIVSASEGTSGVVLAGAFALAGGTGSPLAAPSINILQICMPDGNTATVSGRVTVGVDEADFADIVIPEPTTISLLAIGGFAMLRRRKR